MKDKQKEIEMCRQVYEQPHMSEEQLQKIVIKGADAYASALFCHKELICILIQMS